VVQACERNERDEVSRAVELGARCGDESARERNGERTFLDEEPVDAVGVEDKGAAGRLLVAQAREEGGELAGARQRVRVGREVARLLGEVGGQLGLLRAGHGAR